MKEVSERERNKKKNETKESVGMMDKKWKKKDIRSGRKMQERKRIYKRKSKRKEIKIKRMK